MDIVSLFDPFSLAVVAGGTVLATVLRAGRTGSAIAVRTAAALCRKGFDADAIRAALAVQVREIRADGLLRALPRAVGDADFDAAGRALFDARSARAWRDAHAAAARRRAARTEQAVFALCAGADAAPTAGLAGTLLSLAGMAGGAGDYGAAIAGAVLTTLYGLLLANLIFAPLADAVARRAATEELARDELIEWTAAQIEAEPVDTPRFGRRAA